LEVVTESSMLGVEQMETRRASRRSGEQEVRRSSCCCNVGGLAHVPGAIR
jgi:hypothetical protein